MIAFDLQLFLGPTSADQITIDRYFVAQNRIEKIVVADRTLTRSPYSKLVTG